MNPDSVGKADVVVLEVHDRITGISGQPITWLLVSRSEEVKRRRADGRIAEASITLQFKRLGFVPPGVSRSGCFGGGYSFVDSTSRVSLTSQNPSISGGVFLDLHGLEGHRIGTYLMNQIVCWAKRWPDAQLARITLQESDAGRVDNRLRRNRLYEQFNIEFDYGSDAEMRAGHSLAMLAKDLEPVTTWQENIVVREVADWASDALDKLAHFQSELGQMRRVVKEQNDELRAANKRPLRWALARLWRKTAGPLS